jgi:putative DNA primase/helicase
LNEALIKLLTGGEEMTARPLYGAPFTFIPQFKLWFAGNHRPGIKGGDYGVWRRVQLIPFSTIIPEEQRDPELSTKLKAELSGILNWALAGYRDFAAHGLSPPAKIRTEVEKYKQDEDILADWIVDCCILEADTSAPRDALHTSYAMHCARAATRPMSNKAFFSALRERGYTEAKRGGERCFVGIGVRGSIPMSRAA